MNKEQYAGMLREIGDARKQGGDVSACIAEYRKRYKYVYIYNDAVITTRSSRCSSGFPRTSRSR